MPNHKVAVKIPNIPPQSIAIEMPSKVIFHSMVNRKNIMHGPYQIPGLSTQKSILTVYSIVQIEYHPFGHILYRRNYPSGSSDGLPILKCYGEVLTFLSSVGGGIVAFLFKVFGCGNRTVHSQWIQNPFLHILTPTFSGHFSDYLSCCDVHQIGISISGPEVINLRHFTCPLDQFGCICF